jgi:shikimate kinase
MTSPAEAVVLIGPMGAGKTSIGRKVARLLGLPFYDTDIAVSRVHGPIEQIFATEGEARFRELERAAVMDGLARGGVVSVGGGAVLHPETRRDLASHRVVLLTVDPRTVASRIRDTTRPLLQGEDPIGRWTAVYESRRGVYDELSDVVFDTSSGPIQDVVVAVADWIRAADLPSSPADPRPAPAAPGAPRQEGR